MDERPVDDDCVQNGNKRFIDSLRIAAWGFREAFMDRNFKIQIAFGLAAMVLALLLKVGWTRLALLVLCISHVLCLELINTALEKNVDLASNKHYHPLAKAAKDIAEGAVLVASISSILIGLMILGPPLWALLFR